MEYVVLILAAIILTIVVIAFLFKYYKKQNLYNMFKANVLVKNESDLTKEYYHQLNSKDIDDIVYNDLELDTLFKIIDRTYTNIGKEYMYGNLYSSHIDQDVFQSMIGNWDDDIKLKKVIYELYQLDKYYSECLNLFKKVKEISNKDIYIIFGSLILLVICLVLPLFFGVEAFMFLFLWVAMQSSLYSHYTRKTDDIMSQSFSYCELVHSLGRLSQFHIFLESDKMTIDRMVKKAKKHTRLYRICSSIQRIDIFYLMEFIQGMFFIPLLQCLILKKNKEELNKDLINIYEYVGMVDVSLSIYYLRENYATCLPKKTDDIKLEFKDCYHPEIKNAVKNSFSSDASCIITGTNASGKSTFLKTVGLNMVMARAFHTCFASEFSYYPFQLCSSIHMKDDLDSGDSYYVKEIKVMKNILDMSKEKICLIFIDEILRGTNEKERIAISRAVLNHLFKTQSITLVTTHDLDLVESFPDIKQYCFHDDVRDNMLYCDYTIKEGICKVGNAIRLLEVHHYDQDILDQIKKPT